MGLHSSFQMVVKNKIVSGIIITVTSSTLVGMGAYVINRNQELKRREEELKIEERKLLLWIERLEVAKNQLEATSKQTEVAKGQLEATNKQTMVIEDTVAEVIKRLQPLLEGSAREKKALDKKGIVEICKEYFEKISEARLLKIISNSGLELKIPCDSIEDGGVPVATTAENKGESTDFLKCESSTSDNERCHVRR